MQNKLVLSNLKEFFEFGFDRPFFILNQLEEIIQKAIPGEDISLEYQNAILRFNFSHYTIKSSPKGNTAIHRYIFDCKL